MSNFWSEWWTSESTAWPALLQDACTPAHRSHPLSVGLAELVSSSQCFTWILLPSLVLALHLLFSAGCRLHLLLLLNEQVKDLCSALCATVKRTCGSTTTTSTTTLLDLYNQCWFEDECSNVTNVLRVGIQKQLCLSQTLYAEHAPTIPVPVHLAMFTERRVVVGDTQDREEEEQEDDSTLNTDSATTRTSASSSTSTGSSSSFSRSIKCVEHAPAVFHNIRMLYGVSELDVAHSFERRSSSRRRSRLGSVDQRSEDHNNKAMEEEKSAGKTRTGTPTPTERKSSQQQQQKEGDTSMESEPEKSAGKSAAVFIQSEDSKYVLKTLNDEEKKQLMSMLPKYYHHMQQYPHTTLLPWFLGCYTVYREGTGKPPVSVIMMNNVFYATASGSSSSGSSGGRSGGSSSSK